MVTKKALLYELRISQDPHQLSIEDRLTLGQRIVMDLLKAVQVERGEALAILGATIAQTVLDELRAAVPDEKGAKSITH